MVLERHSVSRRNRRGWFDCCPTDDGDVGMNTEKVISYLTDLDTTIKYLTSTVERYRNALREIHRAGVQNFDSVKAATKMEEIARDALFGKNSLEGS